MREAIAALQVHGVVETRPGAGSFVAADAVERVQAPAPATARSRCRTTPARSPLLEARVLLEPRRRRAGRRAAAAAIPYAEELLDAMDRAGTTRTAPAGTTCDRLFHRQLAAMTGNPVLLALADHVAALMDQPLWQRLRDDSIAGPGRARIHAAEHRMIYEAIVDGDPEAAAFYATQHIKRVRRYMTLT